MATATQTVLGIHEALEFTLNFLPPTELRRVRSVAKAWCELTEASPVLRRGWVLRALPHSAIDMPDHPEWRNNKYRPQYETTENIRVHSNFAHKLITWHRRIHKVVIFDLGKQIRKAFGMHGRNTLFFFHATSFG